MELEGFLHQLRNDRYWSIYLTRIAAKHAAMKTLAVLKEDQHDNVGNTNEPSGDDTDHNAS